MYDDEAGIFIIYLDILFRAASMIEQVTCYTSAVCSRFRTIIILRKR